MERLTQWQDGHAYYPRCFEEPCYGGGCKDRDCPFETAICERLATYEDTGLTPEEIKSAVTPDAIIKLAAQALETTPERLRELAAVDKDGRVVVLPCKVGKKIYYINGKYIIEVEVVYYTIDKNGAWLFVGETYNPETGGTYHCNMNTEKIGKDVFLTREEAERALGRAGDEKV